MPSGSMPDGISGILDYLAEKAAQQLLSFIKIFPFDKLIIVEIKQKRKSNYLN